ncbi:ACT domain-containing protein [Mycena rosella]|uniref:ACT domain-containing protein n=1 Tax=Mycena rosella TaxID=1033263 RepID=A0AAD7CNM1_MYCRO|nr:ACT domain-containing protein [Mycena rosella]
MAPPIDHPCLHLHVLPGAFFVRKLEPNQLDDTLKSIFMGSQDDGEAFLSITRSSEELSVVGQYQDWMPEAYKEFAGWRAIKIAGPMEFNLTGVLSGFIEPLKKAEVGIFAVSTWNTDYVLVSKDDLETAVEALKTDHWTFASE